MRQAARGATLAGKYFHRQYSTVLGRHAALRCFEHVGTDGAIVDELLSTILDPHAGEMASEPVGCALVDVLEPALTTYIANEDNVQTRLTALYVGKQALQPRSTLDGQAATAVSRGAIGPDVASCGWSTAV